MTFIRQGWEALQDRLFFLPPFPEQLDPLALFALLLVGGLVQFAVAPIAQMDRAAVS